MDTEDFPGSPMVRTLPFQCGVLQGFLVRKLRSHMPRSAAKTSKKKKKKGGNAENAHSLLKGPIKPSADCLRDPWEAYKLCL